MGFLVSLTGLTPKQAQVELVALTVDKVPEKDWETVKRPTFFGGGAHDGHEKQFDRLRKLAGQMVEDAPLGDLVDIRIRGDEKEETIMVTWDTGLVDYPDPQPVR